MPSARWLPVVRSSRASSTRLIGVLRGEGVGPEVIDASLAVLGALEQAGAPRVGLEFGGPIGRAVEASHGSALPDGVVDFCRGVFARGGAILNGPGGGRYVYDLRRRLDLFVKISPIDVANGLPEASPLRAHMLEDVDMLVVRENLGGVYQGSSETDGFVARHTFAYATEVVEEFLDAAAALAASRRGRLSVVIKDAGVPAASAMWRECGAVAAERHGVELETVDIDLMAYRIVNSPRDFDVIAAPNLFGDVLGDLAAVLLGSRALSYGASFSREGHGVFQTNHGAAYDIAGSDSANPAGQILSLAALMRQSLGFDREAEAIERGLQEVWRAGWRTADVAGPGEEVTGTARIGELVGHAAVEQLTLALNAP